MYPDKTCPFDIIENWFEISEDVLKSWWADWLRNQLNFSSVYWKERVIIWLFDNDKEWNDKFKWLDKNIFEEYNISNDVRKHKNYNIYWLLLVPPLFREKFISKTSATKRFFQIEHYFSDEILKNYNMIKSDETFSNWIFEIWNSKDAFSKSIEKLDSSEFKNFSVLFDKIKSYT